MPEGDRRRTVAAAWPGPSRRSVAPAPGAARARSASGPIPPQVEHREELIVMSRPDTPPVGAVAVSLVDPEEIESWEQLSPRRIDEEQWRRFRDHLAEILIA